MESDDIRQWSDQQIAAALEPFGVQVSLGMARGVRNYMNLLTLWNRKVSLTSIHGARETLQRHLGESLFGASAVPIESGRLADVGTGAGFPGLALKIARPSLQLDLIEPSLKKAAFLAEVVRNLEFDGISIHRQRIENFTLPTRADWITARAVGDHSRLLGWARLNLALGGSVVLWLGAEDAANLRREPGWTWREPVSIPLSRERVLLIGNPA